MTDILYKEVRRMRRLETAWKKVRDNARKSRSKRTRSEVEAFGEEIGRNLKSIQGQLGKNSFKFDPARGWVDPPKDEKKSPRPIVITPVRSRVVARAILDLIVEQKEVQDFIDKPFSFGGIKKTDRDAVAAVPGAIHAAVDEMLKGNQFFIRSDINGFFRKIPKSTVMKKIRSRIDDQKFCDLIDGAVSVELNNLDQIRKHAGLFPLEDIGVAQGCALSPLFGNILLSEFDQVLNEGHCCCIRYIDDFLILGPSEKLVAETFSEAIKILSKFEMEAYSPSDRPDKAESGDVYSGGLDFLGVEIDNGSIRPSSKNRGKLISSVNEIIHDNLKNPPKDNSQYNWDYGRSFVKCLSTINSVVSGWGNQYYFCNDRKIIDDIDQKIGLMLQKCGDDFRNVLRGLGPLGKRRLLGVKSLHDCKVEPIAWTRADKFN